MGSFSPPAIGRSGAAEESAASPMGGAGRAAAFAMTELLKTNGAPGVSSSMPLPIDPRWGTEVGCSEFALPLKIHRREGAGPHLPAACGLACATGSSPPATSGIRSRRISCPPQRPRGATDRMRGDGGHRPAGC